MWEQSDHSDSVPRHWVARRQLRENKYLFDINIHCVVWVDTGQRNTTSNKMIVYAVIKEPNQDKRTRLPSLIMKHVSLADECLYPVLTGGLKKREADSAC
jgi:hypothetical protein